jgi:hypothetical protein
MRILIAIGMFIIFISAFFIFMTGDAIFKSAFECTEGDDGKGVCVYQGIPGPGALSVFIIAFFIMIDIATVYLIVTNLA